MQWESAKKKQRRYTRNDLKFRLARNPVKFEPQLEGKQNEIKAAEYVKIVAYKQTHNGERPTGNKVDR
jgi:hypothetical protein